MKEMIKVQCIYCGGIFYLLKINIKSLLPIDIKPGEAFPQTCILCNECHYVVFLQLI